MPSDHPVQSSGQVPCPVLPRGPFYLIGGKLGVAPGGAREEDGPSGLRFQISVRVGYEA